MRHWVRIFLVSFVLIGGAALFSYWSVSQYNKVIDDLFVATLSLSRPVIVHNTADNSHNQEIVEKNVSSSTLEESPLASATSSNERPVFVFPRINDKVYAGCVYQLSFQSLVSSTQATSLEVVLIDAGTKETIAPSRSGLTRKNEINLDFPVLDWKVGSVWPGKYYIKVSTVSGKDAVRSNIFTISNLPKDLSDNEKEEICSASAEPTFLE